MKAALASSSTTTNLNVNASASDPGAEAVTPAVEDTGIEGLKKEVGEALQWIRRVANDLNGP
jgi:hypothetical protein